MNYEKYTIVKAKWIEGTVGWLVANATGEYSWVPQKDMTVLWMFENAVDATAFRLRFAL